MNRARKLTGSFELRHIGFLIAAALCSLALIGVPASSDNVTGNQEPASEGKVITPAGLLLMDANTSQPAVGALPVKFVRSPDETGDNGSGRYLLAVNSGFGLQFSATTNRAQQSLSVIDLNAKPQPLVIQNVYFPTPQSVNVGVAFAPHPAVDGAYELYVSGGFENKIWILRFRAGQRFPISPTSPGPNTTVTAPFIDVAGLTPSLPDPNYNAGKPPVYPSGLDISPDGETLYIANNLDDSLGIVGDLHGQRTLSRISLRRDERKSFIYPYDVVVLQDRSKSATGKVYVSCWNDASIAVAAGTGDAFQLKKRIPVGNHPTAMILSNGGQRLYVTNSNDDTVSVIDTATDREIERINVRLSERTRTGNTPESLALNPNGSMLYVANAHSNSLAVVSLSDQARGGKGGDDGDDLDQRSRVRGFIPTGQYPSAVAVVDNLLFVGNGKGTGMENSSVVVNGSGRVPNAPNDRFAKGTVRGGQYSVSLVAGNYSVVSLPDERALAVYTQQVLQNNNLIGAPRTALFKGPTPIKHVIYVIKENRTYDQVFGDLERAGNGEPADGDPSLAIFGAGDAARTYGGPSQNITPNTRALALRFGLLDRFFVNSEASPDGHNWSTAAFSSDYVDKAYRWAYSGRGRTYDYEGFNRLPAYQAGGGSPSLLSHEVTADGIVNYMRRFVPYLNGSRDVAEPESLYLWDLAARSGLSYRVYGEFVATVTADEVKALKARGKKTYPDLSPTVKTLPTKKSLEGHHSSTFRSFDMYTPDSITTDSYREVKERADLDPVISSLHPDPRFRGNSRLGEWLEEFQGYTSELQKTGVDRLPQLSILRLSNDHTTGTAPGFPTPQFSVADNDYAVGRLVEAVSKSAYWKDTAIFILEDDAQDGPDHVDAHRSPALIISAYNRPGVFVHEFHNTVSLIRTIEILLGLEPMNQLDASAVPIDIFRDEADLRPYQAMLPEVSLNNLMNPSKAASDKTGRYWIERMERQDLTHPDMADSRVLNEAIWFSVQGPQRPMPDVARLPVFDTMRNGLIDDDEEEEETVKAATLISLKTPQGKSRREK